MLCFIQYSDWIFDTLGWVITEVSLSNNRGLLTGGELEVSKALVLLLLYLLGECHSHAIHYIVISK